MFGIISLAFWFYYVCLGYFGVSWVHFLIWAHELFHSLYYLFLLLSDLWD